MNDSGLVSGFPLHGVYREPLSHGNLGHSHCWASQLYEWILMCSSHISTFPNLRNLENTPTCALTPTHTHCPQPVFRKITVPAVFTIKQITRTLSRFLFRVFLNIYLKNYTSTTWLYFLLLLHLLFMRTFQAEPKFSSAAVWALPPACQRHCHSLLGVSVLYSSRSSSSAPTCMHGSRQRRFKYPLPSVIG